MKYLQIDEKLARLKKSTVIKCIPLGTICIFLDKNHFLKKP